ncbi:MAG: CotH kinase family protein [Fibrobacter sp.]|nr:CotH kinase family protein [Fibrobacter sp.]
MVSFLLLAGCDKGTENDPEEILSSSSSLGDGNSSGGSSSCSSIDSSGSSSSGGSGSSSSSAEVPKELKWVGNSAVMITEIAPVNTNWLDFEGNDPGWIELYNAGNEHINLSGYSLVEKLTEPRVWIFGNEVIPPKGFRTVFADKRNLTEAPPAALVSGGNNRTHTSWKLEKEGGSVYLIDADWNIRDSANYPQLPPGISWGIVDGGNWKYFGKPTPEKPNNIESAYDEFTPVVSFENSAGFYQEPFTVTIPSAGAGVKVRCTQDGSLPTASSPETSTIYVSGNMVVRCAAYKEGYLTKDVTTASYFVGETVGLPVVSIAVDPVDMFDNSVGYYKAGVSCGWPDPCKQANFYKDIELPIHVEFFESQTSGKTWEIDAGYELKGQWSRMMPKKSAKITMREQYQDGRLHYALFPDYPNLNKFKGFELRNNGNRFPFDFIADASFQSALEGTGVDYQRSRQVLVFYNGEYYGIHDMRERLNEHFVETNYGIDANIVDAVKHTGDDISANGGTATAYEQMVRFGTTQDMTVAENYNRMQTMVDVGNLADYFAAEIYFQNVDWPQNNVRAWRTHTPASPFKFMVYDLDHGMAFPYAIEGNSGYTTNMFNWINGNGESSKMDDKELYLGKVFTNLLKNPDFKRLFINRSSVMLNHFFEPERVVAKITKLASSIPDAEMTRDLKDPKYISFPDAGTREYSFSRTGSALKDFARARQPVVKGHYQSKFDLGGDISVTIQSEGNGIVLMEGMKLPSKDFTGTYFGGTQMQLRAVPNSAQTVFLGWEDGSVSLTRMVSPENGKTYKASFR